jgi:hypothetical protein
LIFFGYADNRQRNGALLFVKNNFEELFFNGRSAVPVIAGVTFEQPPLAFFSDPLITN